MPNPYFKFKQFVVYHNRCAMKVGTDGVLLGAWADVSLSENILDVGTGSGLIALMSAQKNRNANILAIDSDMHAVEQANENFKGSQFTDRLIVRHISFQNLANQSHIGFDHIVSNPPYFVNSLKSPDKSRSLARHDDSLSLNDLIQLSRGLVNDNGKLSLILPFSQKIGAEQIALDCGWHISKCLTVFSLLDSNPKRVLMEFSANNVSEVVNQFLTIELARHQYSAEFKSLVKDFYLHM